MSPLMGDCGWPPALPLRRPRVHILLSPQLLHKGAVQGVFAGNVLKATKSHTANPLWAYQSHNNLRRIEGKCSESSIL